MCPAVDRPSPPQLMSEVPRFATVQRTVELERPPGVLLSSLREDGQAVEDGIVLLRDQGHLTVRPSKQGQMLRIIAEAATPEIADELVSSLLDQFG